MAEFKSEIKDGIHIITCPEVLESIGESIEANVKSWLIMDNHIHVLDFKHVLDLKQNAYRPFILFNQKLKANSKKLFCMNIPEKMIPQMAQEGLAQVFVLIKSLEDLKAGAKPATGKTAPNRLALDVEFINPFIHATQMVFATQASTPLKAGKPYLRQPNENLPMEIAGVISLTNPAFTGSIALCFQAKVFLKIYENMVGEKHEKIIPEIEDAAGELLNIIFGQAKTILNDKKGYALEKALPTILAGEKLTLRHSVGPVMLLPFESEAGTFHLEVVIEKV